MVQDAKQSDWHMIGKTEISADVAVLCLDDDSAGGSGEKAYHEEVEVANGQQSSDLCVERHMDG